jgi:hypothetical protein
VQPPSTLPELIDQLGRTYSPFERLKILGRAWVLLRNMTPEQRMIVASQLGLDYADEVVEAIAKRSGQQASPALLSMIENAQVKGTAHLPELIADLRDPKRRTERLRQGTKAVLDGAEGALEGGTPEVPWLPPAAAAQPAAAPKKRPTPVPAAPRPQAPPPSQAAAAPAPAAPKPAAPPPPVQVPAPVAAAPASAPAPPQPAPPPPAVKAVPPPEPAPVAAAPPPPPKLQPAPVRPAVSEAPPAPVRTAGGGVLAARLAEASSVTERFHVLRRHVGEAKKLPAEDLRSVLESFPDGWARRRALVALLRSGAPGSMPDALALVQTLGSERDRLWCLGTLADHQPLAAQDRDALLAVIVSPTARRRLGVRLDKR